MKEYDTEDLVNIWKDFKNNKKIYYELPSIKEIDEFYKLLINGNDFIYATSFEDCEEKIGYWKYVTQEYKKHDFIMPFTPGMGFELRLSDITKYQVSQKTLNQLKIINKTLNEISTEFFEMEHVSF